MNVPLLDVKAQNLPLQDRFARKFREIIDSGIFILGPEVEALENEVAALCGAKFGIGVSSGTDALVVALMTAGVGPGDEVICPAFTFFATAGSVERLGAMPVFVDVLPEVVAVAKGKATIFVDGSFMRGSDVCKAMALGADIVGMGRMQGLALAAGGAEACIRMLEIVEYEIKNCMGLNGITSLSELDESCLVRNADIVTDPHQFSAFPLINLDDDGYAPSL